MSMILIGQYDSPFVRRVGVALTLYGLPFKQQPWSVFGDPDKIRPYNPLVRVPTLVLADGSSLIESHSILDYLDGLMPPEQQLFPVAEPARHLALKVAALATGMAEKTVSLFYEKRLHDAVSDIWVQRCRQQIGGVLDVLEAERAAQPAPHWFGARIGHADIAVTVALRFLNDAHPGLFDLRDYPALHAHWQRHEALPAFQAVQQAFTPSA